MLLKLLLVLAICPFIRGLSDPVETLLSGDYDANALMNSMFKILGSTFDVLFTEKDDIDDISADISFWCSNQQRQEQIRTTVNDSSLAT